MSEGWIKLHRQITDNSMWLSEPFTKAQAWVDLILIANHKPSYFFVRGNRIDVDRGQLAWSREKIATRWQWSRKKIDGFLKMLEKEQQITQQKSPIINKISISNYETYQEKEQQTTLQKSNRRATEEQQKHTYNNVKNNKNEKNKNIEAHFSLFWNRYDLKKNRVKALAAFKVAIKKIEIDKMLECVDQYKAYCKAEDVPLKYPQGWLNDERWTDDYSLRNGKDRSLSEMTEEEKMAYLERLEEKRL